MSEEDKKKPLFDPNGLYRLKNMVGFTSVMIGFIIAGIFWLFFLVGAFGSFVADDGGEGLDNVLGYLGSWKIDLGVAILLGSTIISGSILFSGIRKV